MPKLCVLLLVVLAAAFVFPGGAAAQTETPPTARAILFFSPTCPHCVEVIEHVLPPIEAAYGERLEVRLYNLRMQDAYNIFVALHEQYPDLPNGVPQLYIGGQILLGSDQIRDHLPRLIDECLAQGGCDWAFQVSESPTATATPVAVASAGQPVYLAYCFDPTCLECERVTYDLEHLQAQYPNLVVEHFDVREDAALIEAMCERYAVPADQRLKTPAIFIGDEYLVEHEIAPERLRALIDNLGQSARSAPWDGLTTAEIEAASAGITERFADFGLLAVAGAGLLDGVNPCAFSTIIFFISYLALVGRGKREILLVGAAFTAAVFMTYLLLGLGLAALVEQFGQLSTVAKIIYGLTAIICLGLAAFSLWDYVQIRRGKLSEIALQLPKALKLRIHSTIRTQSRMEGFVAAAFVAGVLVSIFELACTGQVYLPTIIFMTGVSDMQTTAAFYLVLYNAMFVLPLGLVFGVVYFGMSSQKLTQVFQTNAGTVKLLTAGLFTVLGGWLIWMLIG